MPDTIAIIGGTGKQGSALALRFASGGASIRIGSRHLERAQAVSRQIADVARSEQVQGFENSEAVREAEVVILTVPAGVQIETLEALRLNLQPGTFLVDVTVRLKSDLNSALIAAEHVPDGVKVASAFHTLSDELLKRLSEPIDSDVLICSDAPEATAVVKRLVSLLSGARPVEAGGLKNSRLVENMVQLLIALNRRHKVKHTGLRITGI